MLFSLALILSPLQFQAEENPASTTMTCNKARCNLKLAEQKLWIDHVLWTRNYIVSDLSALKYKDVVLERLLKNQDAIGNSIKPFYGEKAGN